MATTSDWIHLDTTAGTGNGTVAFHMDPNGTGKNRTGKIDGSLAQNATKKKTFTVNESMWFLNAVAGSEMVLSFTLISCDNP